MRIHLQPSGLYSPAMVRVANALSNTLPFSHRIVKQRKDADLCILYVIGLDAVPYSKTLLDRGQQYAVLQCGLSLGSQDPLTKWYPLWKNSTLTWSYYDLREPAAQVGFRFYHSPLGADPAFVATLCDDEDDHLDTRPPSIITSGHVSGPGAEPIEQVWAAASNLNIPITHIGTSSVKGVRGQYRGITYCQPDDYDLADLYLKTRWVAALRHVEGFELPAVEGLVCGARPIVFDQPATRHWYGDLVTYIPDTPNHNELIESLTYLLRSHRPVSSHERYRARARFSWSGICQGFWSHIQQSARDGEGPPQDHAYYRVGRGRPTPTTTTATDGEGS